MDGMTINHIVSIDHGSYGKSLESEGHVGFHLYMQKRWYIRVKSPFMLIQSSLRQFPAPSSIEHVKTEFPIPYLSPAPVSGLLTRIDIPLISAF